MKKKSRRSTFKEKSSESIFGYIHQISIEAMEEAFKTANIKNNAEIKSGDSDVRFSQIGLDEYSSILVLTINSGDIYLSTRYIFVVEGIGKDSISMSARTKRNNDGTLYVDQIHVKDDLEATDLEDIIIITEGMFGKGKIMLGIKSEATNKTKEQIDDYIHAAERCGYVIDGEYAFKEVL